MNRGALVIAASIMTLPAAGCGGDRPAVTQHREASPQWQDVFDVTPDLYAVVRPQALKRDPVFGPFVTSLFRLAQARSDLGAVTGLDALEGCDEIIVGVSRGDGAADDAVLVLRGVPASLDPQKMNDATGRPRFRVVDDRARVPELEFDAGALFVLPDRTWVVALGGARARARQAFATPFGRPAPRVDPRALATLRLDAAALLRPRFEKSPSLGPLVRKLDSVAFALEPGKGGLVTRFVYADDDASAWAEMQVKRIAQTLAKDSPRFSWLQNAEVGREGSAVTLRVALPARLLEELPKTTPADLPL